MHNLEMLQTCPACHSDNRDIAKYCDQCGAALSPLVEGQVVAAQPIATPDPIAVTAPRQPANVNWTALLFLAAIVLGIVWVIKTPSQQQVQQAAVPPMAAAGTAAGGGADNPIGTMQNVQKQLADLKAKLKKDQLDVAALADLYMMYGQIGQTDKVRPYVDNALKAWQRKYPKPDEAARKTLAGVALAALQADDQQAAVEVLVAYHQSDPANLGVIGTIGNLYYEMNEPADAVKYYDMYLAKADPKTQGDDYWNVLVDKATMHLNLAGHDVTSDQYSTAMQLLLRATKESPKHWAAWYNLGQAYKDAEKKAEALAAFKKSLDVATDEQSKYESQKEINTLEGKPAPEPPANPHQGMAMGGSAGGMSLPTPPPGTPNPHAEGGGGM
jgi:tetratricopeptide (TPR) repeat protein